MVIPLVSVTEKLESDKKELQLSINSFDNPTELTGIKAWSQLVLHLIFMKPGTHPTHPEMGIDLESYQFDFMDDAISSLSAAIINQQGKYLKDVPLTAVVIQPAEVNGERILLIQLTFTDSNRGTANSVIAINATPTSRHFLDFDISW